MKKFLVLLLTVFLIPMTIYAKGFENNRNDTARIFNGMYPSYPDAHLIMKWSKDWIPQAHQEEGAWLTNHWTWYSDDYEEGTYYGWDTMNEYGTGEYLVQEFIKMKAINMPLVDGVYDRSEVDMAISEGITVIWNNIAIIKDTIKVYNADTGELVAEFDITTGNPHPGFGNTKVYSF